MSFLASAAALLRLLLGLLLRLLLLRLLLGLLLLGLLLIALLRPREEKMTKMVWFSVQAC